MAPQDDLEHDEATGAQDLTRLLRGLRPPACAVHVPAPVDLAVRAEIWQGPVRRQLSTLLALAHHDLVQMLRQALTDNPLLEEGACAADEETPAGTEHAPSPTASAGDLTDAAAQYDSIWQACVPDDWDAHGLPAPPSEARGASKHPASPSEAIVADVIVRKVGRDHQVSLNDDGMPRLRLRATTRRLVREGTLSEREATPDLDDHLRAAVWLVRSLEYRRRTLLKVATSLVAFQHDCLEHGLTHLRPLALSEVAEASGLPASMVRLVITNTYLATAYGIIALTAFFPRGVKSSAGEARSSLTLKETKQLIAAGGRTRPQPAWLPGSRLSPDEEQRVRQALEAHARHWLTEGDSAAASRVPSEVEEVQRRRDLAWLQSRQNLQGKDRLARLLHNRGPRTQGPFMAVNCAATPELLFEAELFGYERGAFPSTMQWRPGRVELAAGGTLFLEEIDALSPMLQAKILRVLQAKQFEPVGATETLTTDARIIAATHQDLQRLVAQGQFRRDLYDRLSVYPIALPPLRERQEDIRALTMRLLKYFSRALRKELRGISKEAMGWLERYPWPGNVPELGEVIERAGARCQGPTVTAQDLPQALREPSRAPVSSGEAATLPPGGIAMIELEKHLIRQALEQAHGNKSHAAQKLGLSRTQLRTRMRQYGLEDD